MFLWNIEAVIEKHWSNWSLEPHGEGQLLILRNDGFKRELFVPESFSSVRHLAWWQWRLKKAIKKLKKMDQSQ